MNEIAILSGKGGTGKTSLSAAFATLGQNVVADCDVDAANLHLILQPQNYHQEKFISGYKAVVANDTCKPDGLCIEVCRFDAISMVDGKITISPTKCDGCKLCSRICPSNSITMIPEDRSFWFAGNYRNGKMIHARLAPGEENSGKLVNVVREKAKITAKEEGFDTIIIDGPPGTGCPAISSVTGVKKVIIVTEPSQSAFHDLRRIVQVVHNFKIETYIVINKFDLNLEITCDIENWCFENNLPVLGKILFDREIVEAMIQCKSILEWLPESAVSKEIINIWNKLNNNGQTSGN